MEQRIGVNVDFDIQDALDKLQRLNVTMENGHNQALLEVVEDNGEQLEQGDRPQQYRALPLPSAKEILDRLWDNAFLYNNCPN